MSSALGGEMAAVTSDPPLSQKQNRRGVRAVERSLEVLVTFVRLKPELSLEELSSQLDLPKSTMHRLVTSLVRVGFVERTGHGTYRLGLQAALVGLVAARNRLPGREVLKVLTRLRDEIGETIGLGTLDSREHIVVQKVRSSHPFAYDPDIGDRFPAHCSAAGKVLLAQRSDEEIRRMYSGRRLTGGTSHSLSSLEELERELGEVRARGYALDDEEVIPGLRCMSVAIPSNEGISNYSVGVTAPAARLSKQSLIDLYPAIHRFANNELATCMSLRHDGTHPDLLGG